MHSRLQCLYGRWLIAPHRVTRDYQVCELAADMKQRGWVGAPLIGYELPGLTIQLLTGTHRLAAASRIPIRIPVRVYPNNILTRTLGRLRYWQCRLQGKL